ncbi:hypothetical protein JTE90_015200 [Oedothorax gibbosus]|uniref:Uncharacterized protein n=1 Tax=Oedothorax gibbosus TaxID=931172 RepID=A0AAV6V797_9ARAC|nr:hypothetical protein JTE90_015200 [Oedothorax gibbosus]
MVVSSSLGEVYWAEAGDKKETLEPDSIVFRLSSFLLAAIVFCRPSLYLLRSLLREEEDHISFSSSRDGGEGGMNLDGDDSKSSGRGWGWLFTARINSVFKRIWVNVICVVVATFRGVDLEW